MRWLPLHHLQYNRSLLTSGYWAAPVPPMTTFRTASISTNTVRTVAAVALSYSTLIPEISDEPPTQYQTWIGGRPYS